MHPLPPWMKAAASPTCMVWPVNIGSGKPLCEGLESKHLGPCSRDGPVSYSSSATTARRQPRIRTQDQRHEHPGQARLCGERLAQAGQSFMWHSYYSFDFLPYTENKKISFSPQLAKVQVARSGLQAQPGVRPGRARSGALQAAEVTLMTKLQARRPRIKTPTTLIWG